MSIKERLIASGVVGTTSIQRSNQTMTCTVQPGASIYVQKNDRDFDILQGALKRDKFPNSGELLRYVKTHHHQTMRRHDDRMHAYRLQGDAHIDAVIDIIRKGM